jgi:hypothetical protein
MPELYTMPCRWDRGWDDLPELHDWLHGHYLIAPKGLWPVLAEIGTRWTPEKGIGGVFAVLIDDAAVVLAVVYEDDGDGPVELVSNRPFPEAS